MEEEATAIQCRHHWMIESPDGRVSRGVCKICGAQKSFSNSLTETVWEDEPYTEVFSRFWNKRRPNDPLAVLEEEYLARAS